MSSSSFLNNENILLNPLPELRASLTSNSFGVKSYRILEESSFPLTKEDLESVREESSKSGITSSRVVARALVELLGDEGWVGVRLDRAGWTIESVEPSSSIKEKLNRTYESLETLLIDISPSYTKSMNDEIWKRFGMSQDNGNEDKDQI